MKKLLIWLFALLVAGGAGAQSTAVTTAANDPWSVAGSITGGVTTCVGCAASSVLITGTGTNPVITTDTGLTYSSSGSASTFGLGRSGYVGVMNIYNATGGGAIQLHGTSGQVIVNSGGAILFNASNPISGTNDVSLARYEPGGLFLTSNGTLGGTMKAGIFRATSVAGVTVSTPAYSFEGDTDTGFGNGFSNQIYVYLNGTATNKFSVPLFTLANAQGIGFTGGTVDATNDLQLTRYAAKQLMISGDGTGATTNAGWILGYGGFTGEAMIHISTAAPNSNTASLYAQGGNTLIGAASGSSVSLRPNGSTKLSVIDVAGQGATISAGTAASNLAALAVTQTWDSDISTVHTAFTMGITQTTNSASSNFAVWSVDGVPKHTAGIDGSWTSAGGGSFSTLATSSNVTFGAASTIITKGGQVVYSPTAPTVNAGFCTSPSISANNGTAAFTVTIGTGCGASTGTLTMPAASTGWQCDFVNVTTPASNTPSQTGGSTTTVTVTNYARTTGLAANWTDSEVLRVKCLAY